MEGLRGHAKHSIRAMLSRFQGINRCSENKRPPPLDSLPVGDGICLTPSQYRLSTQSGNSLSSALNLSPSSSYSPCRLDMVCASSGSTSPPTASAWDRAWGYAAGAVGIGVAIGTREVIAVGASVRAAVAYGFGVWVEGWVVASMGNGIEAGSEIGAVGAGKTEVFTGETEPDFRRRRTRRSETICAVPCPLRGCLKR